MTTTDRVEYARKCFERNRQIAENGLREMRQLAKDMLDARHGRVVVGGPAARLLLRLRYLRYKRRLVPLIRKTRSRISFYRKIEADLKRGDLQSAIEALSLFAPREETTLETVRRVRVSPATFESIRRSPHALRMAMLQLRDDLIEAQSRQ